MLRFRKSLVMTGLAASGCAMFIYISALAFAVLSGGKIFYRYQFNITIQEVPLFIGAFLLFEAAFFHYIRSVIHTRQKDITGIRNPLIRFTADTAALMLIIAMILIILRAGQLNVIIKSTAVISLIFFSSYFFLSVSRFFTRLFLVKLCVRAGFLPLLSEAATVSKEDLCSSAERLYNHAVRFGIPIAFIGIHVRFPSDAAIKLPHDTIESFCEQTAFQLAENARSYEPWSFSSQNITYLCVVQVKDSQELDATLKRLTAVVSKTQDLFFSTESMPETKVTADIYTTGSFDAMRERDPRDIARMVFERIEARLPSQKSEEVIQKDISVW